MDDFLVSTTDSQPAAPAQSTSRYDVAIAQLNSAPALNQPQSEQEDVSSFFISGV